MCEIVRKPRKVTERFTIYKVVRYSGTNFVSKAVVRI